MPQWEGPSLEGFAGLLLLWSGLSIVGHYIYGDSGSLIAFVGTFLVYVVVGEFVWKNRPRLARRESWPAFWSQFWREVLVGLSIFLLVILTELLLGTNGINGIRYDFV